MCRAARRTAAGKDGGPMKTLTYINLIIALVIGVCCCYQIVFALVRLRGLGRRFEAKSLSRFAVLIAARNESAVIGQLIDSIKAQDYPAELVDVYVVADNCTDNTAAVAAAHGATVYKRQNLAQVGKGYALNFLLAKLAQERPEAQYDGFFVFDADNLLDPHYISEMNKVFSNGCPVVTGYRNAKNFGDNWISAGYGMYFLRESEYLNRPRDYLGSSCAVSGTGFLFSSELLEKVGGWHYFALTEDLEFTLDLIGRGEKIAYCNTAILYDEQPTGFKQSVVQRARWMRGLMQIMSRNGSTLLRTLLGAGSFACYDMLINSMASVLMGLGFIMNVVMFGVGLTSPRLETGPVIAAALMALAGTYLGLFATGWMTLLTEWRRIPCKARRKVLFSFTYPFFMASFMAALAVAMSGGAQWKPIRHTVAVSLGDLDGRR